MISMPSIPLNNLADYKDANQNIQCHACPLTSETSFINTEAEADHFDLMILFV